MPNNRATVEAIYAGLARGDASALLQSLCEDVVWEFGAVDYGIPLLVPGSGAASVRQFLEASRLVEFHHFSVEAVVGDQEWVVGLVNAEFTVRATGRRVREVCQPQVWRFDAQGKVSAMRHAADTRQYWLAFFGEGCNRLQLNDR